MSKVTELKSFLVGNKVINVNVINPMIDSVAVEVQDDVATYKTVATPVAAPVAGAIPAHSTVVLTCSLADSIIYYTIDGSTPNNTKTIYVGPVEIATACTLKAIAYKRYQNASTILTAVYTISIVVTPTATPSAGAVSTNTGIVLASVTADTTIYYTINGDTPTIDSNEYTAAIVITEAITIKAIAVKENYTNSDILTSAYTIS